MKKNKKIFILIAHYLPGQNIGGPLNSVYNIVQHLKEYHDFFILTSDRDMGSDCAFPNIKVNSWLDVEGAKVMYLEPGFKYFYKVYSQLKFEKCDIIYLNSFFDFKYSIYIALLKYLRFIRVNQLIIAPRGELFDAALNFRKYKKRVFLAVANFINIYKEVFWHSTSDFETLSIRKNYHSSKIRLARVLSNTDSSVCDIENIYYELDGKFFLKVIFLSRISKDKNLAFALRILKNVSCLVEFHIYGPIEDEDIWKECRHIMKTMPENVKVSYKGIVSRNLVKSYFGKYDLFLFPTHNENYGHVINESLSVGTPVLISDTTPWRFLRDKGVGWDYSLSNIDDFVNQIEILAKLNSDEKSSFRKQVINSYARFNDKNILIKENLNLFD
jgi:glycosyltransferase involved in cell wall biosynthesis